MLILDTHALVWLDEGNDRLGSQSLSKIDGSLKAGTLFVSAISFWEVAMLVSKKRIKMDIDVNYWRKSLLSKGLKEIALTGEQAIYSAQLADFHGDPADRMITAAAITQSAMLCTADEKILKWKNALVRIDARG